MVPISQSSVTYPCKRADLLFSAFFNDVTFIRPKVPTLYTVLSSGPAATNPEIYGANTGTFMLKKDDVVEIILNNADPGRHPFHLHGHNFQTVARSAEEGGVYVGNETFPKVPMRRDTVLANPNGNIVLRFKADNPDKYIVHPTALVPADRGLTGVAISLPYRMACCLRVGSHDD